RPPRLQCVGVEGRPVADDAALRTRTSLLLRLRAGAADPDAWLEFVQLYTPVLLGWCHLWGLQEADAEATRRNVRLRDLRDNDPESLDNPICLKPTDIPRWRTHNTDIYETTVPNANMGGGGVPMYFIAWEKEGPWDHDSSIYGPYTVNPLVR